MSDAHACTRLVREAVLAIHPYEPGRPSEEVEREIGIRDTVKLASNENCLGASPRALEAGHAALARGTHLYPDGGSYYLRRRLAEKHQVAESEVFVGSGSTEIIQTLALCLTGPGLSAVFSAQAFVMYQIAVQAAGGDGIPTKLDGALRHDLRAMALAIRPDTRLVYVANPNNPTGTYVGRSSLDAFLAAMPAHVVVALDEAYHEYVESPDYPDGIEAFRRGRQVIVLRTFSKIHGLASMRIGYAIGPSELLRALDRVRSPFNVTSVSQAMALAALDDEDHEKRSRTHNRDELQFLGGELARRDLSFTASVANFLLVDVGMPAAAAFNNLMRAGVITRPMAGYGFPTHLRVSVGTRAANERLLAALDAVCRGEG